MKAIYNVYVPIESQEQADRMKQLCIDNGLPYWNNWNGFHWVDTNDSFAYIKDEFFLATSPKDISYHTKVTEQEFINLLTQTK